MPARVGPPASLLLFEASALVRAARVLTEDPEAEEAGLLPAPNLNHGMFFLLSLTHI